MVLGKTQWLQSAFIFRLLSLVYIWGIQHTNFLYCTLQTEYFQDDLFPEIIRTDKPVMTSQEWFRGDNKAPVKISLRPKDMKPCK